LVTLKQIAKQLNISITTVSKALKDYPDVSEKTRKLVRETAELLNYKPNEFAVNLRTKESKTIGLIIPEVVHHFFSNLVKGIISEAEQAGYLVIILQSNESYELEKKQVDLLLRKRVDGILISLANATADFTHLRSIMAQDTPLVMFDKIAKIINCSKIIINDRKAAYNATQHLIDIGCKKIAHFRGPLLPQNSIDRFLGYKQALSDNNIPYNPDLVFLLDKMIFEEGHAFATKIVQEQIAVDGIFINTDIVAIGALTAFNKLGVKVPEQIKIVGFSNWFMASVIVPSLTTINQPGLEMGKRAFNTLHQEILDKKAKKDIVYKNIVLDTNLVIRESTKN
jgi:transcriptional regulator, LacI family